ncbi:MAG: hypothetical protein R3Y28_05385 [Candidatus Gastranaerophilales bacterium]
MSDFNLNSIIPKILTQSILKNINQDTSSSTNTNTNASTSGNSQSNTTFTASTLSQYQMWSMDSTGQSIYVKDMLKLPQTMNELVYVVQNKMTIAQYNEQATSNTNTPKQELSQLQAQILAQLQGVNNSNTQTNNLLANQLNISLKSLPISTSAMINLNDIAALIQMNGKDAIAKLVQLIANATKLGITDVTQLRETARLINASIASASQQDNAQTMKMLMLIYLPWLPLQEGVSFDLDIETTNSNDEDDSVLVITVTTINYGTLSATLILESSNSVHVNLECVDEFPQKELLHRIESDEKNYSMQSVVSFSESNQKVVHKNEKQETKINMSNTNQINPYLLLMSHTIIRHVIEIDKNCSLGVTSHVD